MRTSTFRKQLVASGKQATVKAEVVATMNHKTRTITGTNASTHDDYTREIGIHKVEAFVNGNLWKKSEDITSELMVYNESKRIITEVQLHINRLSNEIPTESFTDKMDKLFS